MSLALQDISHDGLTRPRSRDMALANKVIIRGHDANISIFCANGPARRDQVQLDQLQPYVETFGADTLRHPATLGRHEFTVRITCRIDLVSP